MLAMMDEGEPRHAHPAYWAPFAVVGQGGALEGFSSSRLWLRRLNPSGQFASHAPKVRSPGQ